MNWEMISAVGQMLGAIGVIISIIYLAAQIRNQNKESRRGAMNVLATHWSDLNRSLVENPELATLWLRALRLVRRVGRRASKLRFGAHWGVSCGLPTVFISASWMERSIRGYGEDMSRHFADTVAYPGFAKLDGYTKTLAHQTNSQC